jgi:hypothetical protein
MRKSAIILAALLTARPTLAAEQCLEVKPNLNIDPAMQPTYAKYADTAHCFLRIDGKVIINRTCHIGISGDTREWVMNGVAEVYMNHENHDLSDRPFYARFQRHGRWLTHMEPFVAPANVFFPGVHGLKDRLRPHAFSIEVFSCVPTSEAAHEVVQGRRGSFIRRAVTLIQTSSRRASRTMTRTYSRLKPMVGSANRSWLQSAADGCAGMCPALSFNTSNGRGFRHTQVAERFVVPLKLGNSGGGKGPQFKTDAIRGEGPGRLGNL